MTQFTQSFIHYVRRSAFSSQPEDIAALLSETPPSAEYPVRVGFWPILDEVMPEVATGFMLLLSCLLEQHSSALVYRLCVRIDDSDGGSGSASDSQFTVDDWGPEGLDENVALWGHIDRDGDGLSLRLTVENDASESEEPVELVYEATNWAALVAQAPEMAQKVLVTLGLTPADEAAWSVDETPEVIERLLTAVFRWERLLMLAIAEPVEGDAGAALDEVIAAADEAGTDAGALLAASTVARGIYHPDAQIRDASVERTNSLLGLPVSRNAVRWVAEALYDIEQVDAAFEFADGFEVPIGDDASVALLARERRLGDLFRALQKAIERDTATAQTYEYYGDVITLFHQSNLMAPSLVLTAGQERTAAQLLQEGIRSYEEAFQRDRRRLRVLAQKLSLMAELNDDAAAMADDFEQLVAADDSGQFVRSAIEAFQALDDVGFAVDVMADAVDVAPERFDMRLNLAYLLILTEDFEGALEELTVAERLAKEPGERGDVEQLMLSANDPEFELRMGQITELVNAGKRLPNSDIEYLEGVVEEAPFYVQAYLLLAQAYSAREDYGAALEVLLDAQRQAPEAEEVLVQLARVLWLTGEQSLAFDFLNRGLAAHPDSVPLLALTGRYLFDEGQEEEARLLLVRAESINRRHSALAEVKRYIARSI